MIQRIQTVYLALVLLCGAGIFLTAFSTFSALGAEFNFSIYGLKQVQGNSLQSDTNDFIIMLLTAAYSIAATANIFLYNNRKLQIKICNFNLLIIAGAIVLEYFFSEKYLFNITEMLGVAKSEIEISYGIGTILPLFALVFNLLASRAIKKDEALVRSADRIR